MDKMNTKFGFEAPFAFTAAGSLGSESDGGGLEWRRAWIRLVVETTYFEIKGKREPPWMAPSENMLVWAMDVVTPWHEIDDGKVIYGVPVKEPKGFKDGEFEAAPPWVGEPGRASRVVWDPLHYKGKSRPTINGVPIIYEDEICACGVLKERCDRDAGCGACDDPANYPPGTIFEKPESPD